MDWPAEAPGESCCGLLAASATHYIKKNRKNMHQPTDTPPAVYVGWLRWAGLGKKVPVSPCLDQDLSIWSSFCTDPNYRHVIVRKCARTGFTDKLCRVRARISCATFSFYQTSTSLAPNSSQLPSVNCLSSILPMNESQKKSVFKDILTCHSRKSTINIYNVSFIQEPQ